MSKEIPSMPSQLRATESHRIEPDSGRPGQPLLQTRQLDTGYGKKQVLSDISVEIGQGEIMAVIGPNGSGKSTLLKALCGLIPAWSGEIRFSGTSITGSTPAANIARGLGFAPQGNRVFDELTVKENLEIGGFHLPRKLLKNRIQEMYELFPTLAERARDTAGKLSGGQQQMLALARVLIPQPKLLMLDEPSLGLSPVTLKTVFETLSQLNQDAGITFLIVEQKVREVLKLCHRVYSLKLGRVAFAGSSDELVGDTEKLKELFL